MRKIKKKNKPMFFSQTEDGLTFSCELQEFKETESLGKFKGILVNMQGKDAAKGVYRFKKGSMKKNENKNLLLQYNHNGNQIPVGTLVGKETEKGFEVEGTFHLKKDESGNYINQDAVKLYSLMKDLGANFEMSVGGFIKKFKECIENGKWYIDILEFEAYEGSLTPRGAVAGSKVTKVFNENLGGKEMGKEELTILLNGILEGFKADILSAGTDEEIKALPEKIKEISEKFDGMKETLEADLSASFSKQIDELNDVIKGLKADFKATPQEATVAEQFSAMLKETEKNGSKMEVVFTKDKELVFTETTETGKKAIKTAYASTILERILESNPVLKDITFISLTDGSLTIPREVAGLPETGWVGESAERTETAANKVDNVVISLHQLYAMPVVTNKLLAVNYVGYANFLLKRVEYALALKLADTVFSGTGVNMPLGMLKDPVVTQQQELDTTDDTTFVDSIIDIYYSVNANIASKSKWYFSRETWCAIAKLKNARKDFYITDLNTGNERTLMTRPVEIIESTGAGLKGLKNSEAGDVIGVFADVKIAMIGIQNNDMAMRLEDKMTSKGLTKFYIEKGVGLGVQLPEYITKIVKK
ncbi:MAG: phage major capsid protein [Fusobacteriales bacterium]|nr:MAG: phage major capsid protein [Fusobacteriales bacterium]